MGMKKIKTGLTQSVASIVIGFVITTAVAFLAEKGWIPSYSVILLSLFNIITSILSMLKMRRWGVFYAIGWLISSIVFAWIGLLGTTGIIFNIIVPLAILGIRLMLWINQPILRRKTNRR
jgi:hypothetical protein